MKRVFSPEFLVEEEQAGITKIGPIPSIIIPY